MTANACAAGLLDTVPLVMRFIRAEMRSSRTPGMSLPQFRALVYLRRNPGASLSSVADHIGFSLPSMSKLVDGLVARGLVGRETHRKDRRLVTLSLTAQGQSMLQVARRRTRLRLAERLKGLADADRAVVVRAMNSLQDAFGQSCDRLGKRPQR